MKQPKPARLHKSGTGVIRRGRPPSHGMHGTRTYHAWLALRAACNNKRHKRYATTGAYGISYPEAWDTFEGFLADMGEAPSGAALKRKDTKLNYTSDNCYWS